MSSISLATLRKISVAFGRINKTTNKLYVCSSDDFSLLSARFRQSHNNTSALSQNALHIKQLMQTGYSIDTLHAVQGLFEQSRAIENTTNSLKKSASQAAFQFVFNEDIFYLQLHNLIQDLTTLQLLIATIRLGNQETIGTDFLFCDKQINKFIESIRAFYLKSQDIKQVHQLSKLLEEKDLLDDDGFIDTPLSLIEQRLRERYTLLTEQMVLAEAAEKTSGRSLSEVITSLQFEDIIRQKMEHVTAMQQETVTELSALNADSLKHSDSLYTLARIREISDLQVAQLVHTSKDYQQAIQSIINQFSTIVLSMQHFTALGNTLLASSRHSFLYQTLDTVLQQNFNFDLLNQQAAFYDHSVQGLKQIFTLFNSFAIILDAFAEDMEKTSAVIQANSVSQQQKNLLQDIISGIRLKINEINQYHAQFASHYILHIHRYEPVRNVAFFGAQVDTLKSDFGVFKKNITEWEVNVLSSIKENKRLVTLMQKELTIGVKRIKFYNQFDKLIKSIISEFDNIHKLIAFTDSIEVSEEVLARFKSLYTMQSEYLVHEQVNTNGATDDLMVEYESSIELF